MKTSLTYGGVFVILAGTFLVNSLGFTDACASEISDKAVTYGPMIVGSVMALIGRYRLGGVTPLGIKK